jgi:hypothetical protein
VPVSLGDRSYDIAIGEGLLARAGDIVAPFLKRPLTAIVTDENVAAAHLATLPGLSVKSVSLAAPEQGLDEATLDATDVIVWWGHVKNLEVTLTSTERVAQRVMQGKLSLVALHSAHWSRPFVRLMQERSREDALKSLPPDQRAGAKLEMTNAQVIGVTPPPRGAKLTPWMEKTGDNTWTLTLPNCVFPA